MLEQMLQNVPALMALLPILFAVNLMLSGLYKGLDVIKDKTKTKVDNKIAAALNKASAVIQKILDMVGYNPKH
jgi:hypothetical protein